MLEKQRDTKTHKFDAETSFKLGLCAGSIMGHAKAHETGFVPDQSLRDVLVMLQQVVDQYEPKEE